MLPEVSYPGRARVPYPYLDLVIVIAPSAALRASKGLLGSTGPLVWFPSPTATSSPSFCAQPLGWFHVGPSLRCAASARGTAGDSETGAFCLESGLGSLCRSVLHCPSSTALAPSEQGASSALEVCTVADPRLPGEAGACWYSVIVLAALCLGLLLLDIERTLLRIANVLEHRQAECAPR